MSTEATDSAPDHNRQIKAAVVNDYSSFGRCSLAVTAPILAAMKVQCCPVPTAIFTNHTGFARFTKKDLTDALDSYIADWLATGLRFNAVATGFLASVRQVDFVKRFAEAFASTPETLFLFDPVMGDYGRLYPSYPPQLAEAMREILPLADVLTPNLTEACILAKRPYTPEIVHDEAALEDLAAQLLATGRPRAIVISGIPRGEAEMLNFTLEKGKRPQTLVTARVGGDRSGTGDVFSSVILGKLLRGESFDQAVRDAAAFVLRAVRRSVEMQIPRTDGLAFEEVLSDLMA